MSVGGRICSFRVAMVAAITGAALACNAGAWAEPSPSPKASPKSGQRAKARPKSAQPAKKKASASPAETATGPQVRDFQAFCDSWMQKLRDREAYNTSHIEWANRDGQMVGEHVAYSQDCTCIAREEPGKDPIGKITYREMRYRQQGATQSEALTGPGTIVEQSDVTEIFRFGKGRWQY